MEGEEDENNHDKNGKKDKIAVETAMMKERWKRCKKPFARPTVWMTSCILWVDWAQPYWRNCLPSSRFLMLKSLMEVVIQGNIFDNI